MATKTELGKAAKAGAALYRAQLCPDPDDPHPSFGVTPEEGCPFAHGDPQRDAYLEGYHAAEGEMLARVEGVRHAREVGEKMQLKDDIA